MQHASGRDRLSESVSGSDLTRCDSAALFPANLKLKDCEHRGNLTITLPAGLTLSERERDANPRLEPTRCYL